MVVLHFLPFAKDKWAFEEVTLLRRPIFARNTLHIAMEIVNIIS